MTTKESIKALKEELEKELGKEEAEKLFQKIEHEEHVALMVVDAMTEEVLDERVQVRLEREVEKRRK